VREMIKRITPKYIDSFEVKISTAEHDYFELTSQESENNVKIKIVANSGIALASGYNWYLEKYLFKSISFTGDNRDKLPD